MEKIKTAILSALVLALSLYIVNLYYLYQPESWLHLKINSILELAYRRYNFLGTYEFPRITIQLLSNLFNFFLASNMLLYLVELIFLGKSIHPVRTAGFLAAFPLLDILSGWTGDRKLLPLAGYLLLAITDLCSNKLSTILNRRYPLPKIQKPAQFVVIILLVLASVPTLLFYERTHVAQGSSFFDYYKKVSLIDEGKNPLDIGFYDKRFLLYPLSTHYLVVIIHKTTSFTLLEVMSKLLLIAQLITLLFIFKLAEEAVGNRLFAALVTLEGGLIMSLAGLSFVGNFIQATGNAVAFASILLFVKYLKTRRLGYLLACAVFAGLIGLVHWLPAIIFLSFYAFASLFYIKISAHRTYFLAIMLAIVGTYILLVLPETGMSGALPELLKPVYIKNNFPVLNFFYSNIVPQTQKYPLSNLMLAGFSLIGLIQAKKESSMRPIYLLLGISLGWYLLLRNYLIIFYPDRIVPYIALFTAFFTAYGAYHTTKTALVRRVPIKNIILLGFVSVILLVNIGIQESNINQVSKFPQALNNDDRNALFWLKENSNSADVVISDALRTEMVYGFTEVTTIPPTESISLFENDTLLREYGKGGLFAYLPAHDRWYGFPSTDLVEVEKNQSIAKKWADLTYETAKNRLDRNGREVFKEGGAVVYRIAKQTT